MSRGWQLFQMNRGARAGVTPRFLGGKRKDRRDQFAKSVEDLMHCALRCPPPRRIRRIAVHSILRNIDIQTAQVDGTKVIDRVVDPMKLESLVSGSTIDNQLIQPLQNPAIDESCSGGLRPPISPTLRQRRYMKI